MKKAVDNGNMHCSILYMVLSIMILIASSTSASSSVGLSLKSRIDTDSLEIKFAKFSKDSKYVYVVSEENIYKISTEYDAVVSKFDNTFEPSVENIISLNISANGDSLATHDGQGNIHFWDTKKEKVTGHYIIPKAYENQRYRDITLSLDFSKVIACIDTGNAKYFTYSEMVAYDIAENLELNRLKVPDLEWTIFSKPVISRDGQKVGVALNHFKELNPHDKYFYNDILVYKLDDFEELSFIDGFTIGFSPDSIQCIQFSYDDKYIDRTLRYRGTIIYDVDNQSVIKKINWSDPSHNSKLFNRSYNYILCCDSTLELFDIEDDSYSKSYDYYAEQIDISENDEFVFISDSNIVYIFDVKETAVRELTNNDKDITVRTESNRIVIRSEKELIPSSRVSICDLLGREIISKTYSARNEISINHNLTAGIYLCSVTVGTKTCSYRIQI